MILIKSSTNSSMQSLPLSRKVIVEERRVRYRKRVLLYIHLVLDMWVNQGVQNGALFLRILKQLFIDKTDINTLQTILGLPCV